MVRQKTRRFRLRDSDRSGFTHKEIDLVQDEGFWVSPDEFDRPPPSDIPLGGEGDVSAGDTRVSYTSTATPSDKDFQTQSVTAAGGITFPIANDSSHTRDIFAGWIYAAGASSTVDITQNPQITAAAQNDLITIECVSNTIILENSNGLVTKAGKPFVMTSGAIISFFYSATDNLWHETSRSHRILNLGE